MYRAIIHDDICEECRCGAEVEEGDIVQFFSAFRRWECDICPSCEERHDEAASREGEVKDG